MSELDDQEQRLRLDLMTIQIERLRQEMRWEPYKAVAIMLAGVAAMAGIILCVTHLIR